MARPAAPVIPSPWHAARIGRSQVDSDGQCDPRFFAAFWDGRDQADAIFGLRKTRDDGLSRVLISELCRIAILPGLRDRPQGRERPLPAHPNVRFKGGADENPSRI